MECSRCPKPKPLGQDRLILDTRPVNLQMPVDVRWLRTLGAASALLDLGLEDSERFLFSAEDIKIIIISIFRCPRTERSFTFWQANTLLRNCNIRPASSLNSGARPLSGCAPDPCYGRRERFHVRTGSARWTVPFSRHFDAAAIVDFARTPQQNVASHCHCDRRSGGDKSLASFLSTRPAASRQLIDRIQTAYEQAHLPRHPTKRFCAQTKAESEEGSVRHT